MAKKKKKGKKEKPSKKEVSLATVKFSRKNTMFFGIGLLLIIIGFILLATGDIVIAPILLVVGYLVFFPLGILLK
jgi:hypothetical protein